MKGLSTGTLEAIDVVAQTIRVDQVTYRLAEPGLMKPLEVGQRVTVAWVEAGSPQQARIAQAVSIERTWT
jgi:hypothetical protein